MQIKKLWLLRAYITLLETVAQLLLVCYIASSLYVWVLSSNSFWTSILLGAGGSYIVYLSIVVLITAQIIQLFLNIHDDVSDMRLKAINPDVELKADNYEETKQKQYKSIGSIITMAIAILVLIINFSKALTIHEIDHRNKEINNEINNENPYK